MRDGRILLPAVAALLWTFVQATPAPAQSYPDKPIKNSRARRARRPDRRSGKVCVADSTLSD